MNGLRRLALIFRDLREAGHCLRDEGRHLARLVGVQDAVDAEEPAVRVGACASRAELHVGFWPSTCVGGASDSVGLPLERVLVATEVFWKRQHRP